MMMVMMMMMMSIKAASGGTPDPTRRQPKPRGQRRRREASIHWSATRWSPLLAPPKEGAQRDVPEQADDAQSEGEGSISLGSHLSCRRCAHD
jgi:hypothetical protein